MGDGDQEYSERETARRRDKLLHRLLHMQPQPRPKRERGKGKSTQTRAKRTSAKTPPKSPKEQKG